MKMHNLSLRSRFYTQGGSYEPICAYRQPVVPGQSQSIEGALKFQTAAFSKNILASAIGSIMFFYVPNRLVWDDWTGFISQDDDFAGTFPTTATAWSWVYDRSATTPGAVSSLFRRAYKLTYNQYFGQEEMGAQAWYSNIETDTDIAIKHLKNTEQWAQQLILDGQIANPTYDATTVPIDLNDFHRQMISARSQRKANSSGDKYVDALRRMGVEPDWRIQNAPEFLGRADMDIYPVKTFDTGSTNLGDSTARYEGTLNYKTKRKMFAEHGYIVGIFCLRPHIMSDAADQLPDARHTAIEDFYLADNFASLDEYDGRIASASATTIHAPRFANLRNGGHYYGNGADWAVNFAPTDAPDYIYPDGQSLPVTDELTTGEVAILNMPHAKGSTPVPKNSI